MSPSFFFPDLDLILYHPYHPDGSMIHGQDGHPWKSPTLLILPRPSHDYLLLTSNFTQSLLIPISTSSIKSLSSLIAH